MQIQDSDIATLLIQHGFSKKKVKEYHTPTIFKDYWPEIELAPFCDKAETKGILLFETTLELRAVKFELGKIKSDPSGLSKQILCDFCFTLQPRAQTALITFDLNREKTKTLAFYCCADLQCSLHVRGLTDAALRSKSQIREDITPEDRIVRFSNKTTKIFAANLSTEISK